MRIKFVCVVMIALLVTMLTMRVTVGEEVDFVKMFEIMFENHMIHRFLERRGILKTDTEAYDYANEFLHFAQDKDTDSMKKMFAPNAIDEIGEQELTEMLDDFVKYFQAESFTLEMNIGPATSESIDHGKRSKELRGPLEISTNKGDFRFAIKCVAYDDWDEGNVGIWSIYIIAREKDTDQEHPYIGDKNYLSGIYFDIKRPD